MVKAEEKLIVYSIVLRFANRDPYESKIYFDKPNIEDIMDAFNQFKLGYSPNVSEAAFVSYRLDGIEIKEHIYELKSSSTCLTSDDDNFDEEVMNVY